MIKAKLKIQTDTNEVIGKLDEILKQENFSAYQQIRQSLNDTIDLILNNKIEESRKEIAFSIRLLQEAPPKDKDLGYETLIKMDAIHKQIVHLLN